MHYTGPEKGLIWAVIKRAVFDAAGLADGGAWSAARTKREARRWLYDWHESDTSFEFTFPWCCEALDLCPFETRTKVQSEIRQGHITHSSKNKTVAGARLFFDAPDSPTEQEVHFL